MLWNPSFQPPRVPFCFSRWPKMLVILKGYVEHPTMCLGQKELYRICSSGSAALPKLGSLRVGGEVYQISR